jgi:hypothetical protein
MDDYTATLQNTAANTGSSKGGFSVLSPLNKLNAFDCGELPTIEETPKDGPFSHNMQ